MYPCHVLQLCGPGNAYSVLTEIVNGIPLTEEGVAKYHERASWLWDILTHESRDTRTLDLKDIVVRADGKVVPSQSKGQVWEAVTLLTLNSILTVEGLLSAKLPVPSNTVSVHMRRHWYYPERTRVQPWCLVEQ